MKINCHVKKMCLFEYESLINGINYLSINIEMRREVYQIIVRQTNDGVKEASVTIDGFVRQDRAIQLVNDHQEHLVEVRMPPASM